MNGVMAARARHTVAGAALRPLPETCWLDHWWCLALGMSYSRRLRPWRGGCPSWLRGRVLAAAYSAVGWWGVGEGLP